MNQIIMDKSKQNNISQLLAMKDAFVVLSLDDLRAVLEEIVPKYTAPPPKEKDEQINSKGGM